MAWSVWAVAEAAHRNVKSSCVWHAHLFIHHSCFKPFKLFPILKAFVCQSHILVVKVEISGNLPMVPVASTWEKPCPFVFWLKHFHLHCYSTFIFLAKSPTSMKTQKNKAANVNLVYFLYKGQEAIQAGKQWTWSVTTCPGDSKCNEFEC